MQLQRLGKPLLDNEKSELERTVSDLHEQLSSFVIHATRFFNDEFTGKERSYVGVGLSSRVSGFSASFFSVADQIASCSSAPNESALPLIDSVEFQNRPRLKNLRVDSRSVSVCYDFRDIDPVRGVKIKEIVHQANQIARSCNIAAVHAFGLNTVEASIAIDLLDSLAHTMYEYKNAFGRLRKVYGVFTEKLALAEEKNPIHRVKCAEFELNRFLFATQVACTHEVRNLLDREKEGESSGLDKVKGLLDSIKGERISPELVFPKLEEAILSALHDIKEGGEDCFGNHQGLAAVSIRRLESAVDRLQGTVSEEGRHLLDSLSATITGFSSSTALHFSRQLPPEMMEKETVRETLWRKMNRDSLDQLGIAGVDTAQGWAQIIASDLTVNEVKRRDETIRRFFTKLQNVGTRISNTPTPLQTVTSLERAVRNDRSLWMTDNDPLYHHPRTMTGREFDEHMRQSEHVVQLLEESCERTRSKAQDMYSTIVLVAHHAPLTPAWASKAIEYLMQGV